MVYTILLVIQVVIAISLVSLILVQHGKGADAGAAFGSGASGTVFGAQGSANFLSHATAALATVFIILSLVLAYMINTDTSAGVGSVTDKLQQPAQTRTLDDEAEQSGTAATDATQEQSKQQSADEATTDQAEQESEGETDAVTAEIPD